MKTLYNIVEGLLDIDDQDIDNMSDGAYEHMCMHMWTTELGLRFDPYRCKYDSKKKIVKAASSFCFDVYGDRGKLEIGRGHYSLDEWTIDGTVSFDCGVIIHSSALLRCNLKYSMLNHIGDHIIFILDRGDTYKDHDALKNFFDVLPNKNCRVSFTKCPSNEVMQMPVWAHVAGVEMIYDPKPGMSFNFLEYKDITAQRIRIKEVGLYFKSLSTKSHAKNMNDFVNKYGNSDEFKRGSLDAYHSIEKLIENNEKTKIFLTYNFSNIAEYCTLDPDGDVKIQYSKGVQWFKM